MANSAVLLHILGPDPSWTTCCIRYQENAKKKCFLVTHVLVICKRKLHHCKNFLWSLAKQHGPWKEPDRKETAFAIAKTAEAVDYRICIAALVTRFVDAEAIERVGVH